MERHSLVLKRGRGIVIVAHPDDETIWMGGTLLLFSEVSWTIFSLCRASDPDRSLKFHKACRVYRAQAKMSDIEDEGIMNIAESVPKIQKAILQQLRGRRFRYIFTHSPNGEYGHPRHKGVSRAVRGLLKERSIISDESFGFAYVLDEEKGCAKPKERFHFRVLLPPALFQKKREIISSLYGFSKSSFEYCSCYPQETFHLLSL